MTGRGKKKFRAIFGLRLTSSIMEVPSQFPELPILDTGVWPEDVVDAHTILCDGYHSALRVVCLEDPDPLQIAHHVNSISTDSIGMLEAMELFDGTNGPLPVEWLHAVAEVLGKIVVALHDSHRRVRYVVMRIGPVTQRSSWF
jgi:hypothetical protein